ncbi:MAG: hypothetical protein EOP04_02815 [Proteobacteria bacterium]|nr:MAG: hypothetical protein EOP04_02815 [Pseudomonadota bacterium]
MKLPVSIFFFMSLVACGKAKEQLTMEHFLTGMKLKKHETDSYSYVTYYSIEQAIVPVVVDGDQLQVIQTMYSSNSELTPGPEGDAASAYCKFEIQNRKWHQGYRRR